MNGTERSLYVTLGVVLVISALLWAYLSFVLRTGQQEGAETIAAF